MRRPLAALAAPFLLAWTPFPPGLEVLDGDEFLVTCRDKVEACAKKAASHCKSDTFTAIDTSYQVDEKAWKASPCPPNMMAEEAWGRRVCIQNPAAPPAGGLPHGGAAGLSITFRDSVDARRERQDEMKRAYKVRYACDPEYLKKVRGPAAEVMDDGED